MARKSSYGSNQRKVLGTHIITKDVGNLRGFSTFASFLRPSNVADKAINIQAAPDGTIQLRRGYQCQALQSLTSPSIGGLGLGTLDDPVTGETKTVTLNIDGNLFQKLTKQVYFYYDGRVMGDITGITNASPAEVTSIGHGLQTGAKVIIRGVAGMIGPGGINLNNKTFTITRTSANTFRLNGTDTSLWTAYGAGTGNWSIAFADSRYLTMTIFTDPRYINTVNESITCNVTANRSAQIVGNFTSVNTVNVEFGHELAVNDVIQFYSSTNVLIQRTVLGVTDFTVQFDGTPVSVSNGTYINQFFDIPFGKGFNTLVIPQVYTLITTITDPVNGIYGLKIASNGNTIFPAAFLQIFEPQIITSNSVYTIDFWYWQAVNKTIAVPFPGSASLVNQNSPDFEIASMAVFDDVLYIANGRDYPQKFDGQTVYRAGMPIGVRPTAVDNVAATIKPFIATNKYEYAVSYEQVDHVGHIVEGEISEVWKHTVVAPTAAIDVIVANLTSTVGANWNTNTAIAVGGTATVYGPDSNGYWYHYNGVFPGFTLNEGDSGYYLDTQVARINDPGGILVNVITLVVDAGHGVTIGDEIYFPDITGTKQLFRVVASVTPTTITLEGDPVSVKDNDYIQTHKVSTVFNGVAIVSGAQTQVNTIVTLAGNTINPNDIVSFIDADGRLQRRLVTAAGGASIDVDGIPVDVSNATLISSETKLPNGINLQRLGVTGVTPHGTTLGANAPISNNLRINIYRTEKGASFQVNGNLFLVAAIPNNGLVAGLQTITDSLADVELGREFDDPIEVPNPPPISKYLRAFGNQLFYAGGEIGNPEHSDLVFFSEGNQAEAVSIATNSFNVPNADDDITGIGVSGSTLITTKNQSLWASSGNFISGDINTIQIAPGSNIGCVAHASIVSVGSLMYFLHTNGVYAITEGQLFPTDKEGNPIPISSGIDSIFRTTNFLPQTKYVLKRAVAKNYTKDLQYLLFLPCEDANSTTRTANSNSILLSYDYQGKNWFWWDNMNAAGGMAVIDDDLYFQTRATSGVAGMGIVYAGSVIANLFKQHRFYRLIDHADHAGIQRCEWRSSWDDLGQPEVRKKYCRCILLMDRLSDLYQYNRLGPISPFTPPFNYPITTFSSYLDRIPNLQSTIAAITQTDEIRNAGWSTSGWGWNNWSGYQDSFITINLKGGTVAKSIQVGFTIQGINMDIRFAGFQLEAIPENRNTVVR